MVRCDRFVIEKRIYPTEHNIEHYNQEISYEFSQIIYDRVDRKIVAEIKTGLGGLDKDIAKQILTMLNIAFIGDGD